MVSSCSCCFALSRSCVCRRAGTREDWRFADMRQRFGGHWSVCFQRIAARQLCSASLRWWVSFFAGDDRCAVLASLRSLGVCFASLRVAAPDAVHCHAAAVRRLQLDQAIQRARCLRGAARGRELSLALVARSDASLMQGGVTIEGFADTQLNAFMRANAKRVRPLLSVPRLIVF